MKNYLKDKKVLVGLAIVVAGVGYYFYDQNKKSRIKAKAEELADTLPEVSTNRTPAANKPKPTQLVQSGANVLVNPNGGKSIGEKVTMD